MLDSHWVTEHPQEFQRLLERRRYRGLDTAQFLTKLEQIREVKGRVDGARAERNRASKEIGNLMSQGKKAEAEVQKKEAAELGEGIAKLEAEMAALDEEVNSVLLGLPNVLDEAVPDGADETANLLIREWGRKPTFDFEPKPHFELGEALGILDFEGGVKLSGSRFYAYRGLAARLERALVNFMLDLHTTRFGYEEAWVPALVNDACMTTTGQYPKFRGDFYRLDEDGLSLIPTAEVPLVNLFRDEILAEEKLPVRITAATSCFRREAGAAGKDTRGLVRVHQFQKVELVQLVHPDASAAAHEDMLTHAEAVLQALGLPYRVVLLCSGDIGATAAKTYDLEVWLPGLGRYQEISSVSNCLDYQARRGMIRFRPSGPKSKPMLVHTLNGSGLAAGRTLVAIMENYQKKDGSFDVPEALRPYLDRKPEVG